MSALGGAFLYWAAVIALMLEVRREILDEPDLDDGPPEPRRRIYLPLMEGVLVVARLPRREIRRFAPYLIAEAASHHTSTA